MAITSWQIDGETLETVTDFIFLGSKITADGDCSHEIKDVYPWKKSYDQPRQHIKKQRHYFANKGPSSQGYGFFSSHVWMWELDYKESWVLKNWCFWTVLLEKTLESPLDCKEIQPVHLKGNQSWIFIGRTDVEAGTPITLATWCEELTHLKRPRCWERLKAGREGNNREWDGCMASLIQWTWVQVNSGSWIWTGRPGVLQSMGLQRVRHNWATELNWTEASLSITNPWSLPKLMSIESVMPSNHLIICCPFSSCLQSFPASGSFPRSQFFASGGQSAGVSASASVLSLNIQDWFPLG